jgi:putative membrane protein
VLVAALTGPIDASVDTSFSMHMIQHLMLTMVAAPLLLLGAPLTLAFAALPKGARRPLASVVHSRPARWLANPLVAWSAFFTVMWAAHFTGLYEASLRSAPIHAVEHLLFLFTALVFWAPIVRADPSPSPLSYPARILYLFVAMPAMALLGLALVSARQVLYATYAQAEGARALGDQQTAGAIMWAGTMVLIVPALGFVAWGWMAADEREGRRIDAQVARAARMEGGST